MYTAMEQYHNQAFSGPASFAGSVSYDPHISAPGISDTAFAFHRFTPNDIRRPVLGDITKLLKHRVRQLYWPWVPRMGVSVRIHYGIDRVLQRAMTNPQHQYAALCFVRKVAGLLIELHRSDKEAEQNNTPLTTMTVNLALEILDPEAIYDYSRGWGTGRYQQVKHIT